jgi:hypothetical protein
MGWMTEELVFGLLLFTSGKRALDTHLIGGWVDPRAGLHTVENRIPLSQSWLLIMHVILIGLKFI